MRRTLASTIRATPQRDRRSPARPGRQEPRRRGELRQDRARRHHLARPRRQPRPRRRPTHRRLPRIRPVTHRQASPGRSRARRRPRMGRDRTAGSRYRPESGSAGFAPRPGHQSRSALPPARPARRASHRRSRTPRGHWFLVSLLIAVFTIALLIEGYTHGVLGENSADEPDTAGQAAAPAAVLNGGPVINAAGARPRSYSMPARTIALTFDDGPDPT